MPPRKSNVSVASANGEAGPGGAAAAGTPSGKEKEKERKEKDKDEIAIEDLTMPRTMIQRLAKGVLPEGTQLQKDAVTALCKSATVFVSHVAGAAADECAVANRRTVNPNDVFAALRETEHAAMVPRLERELARWIDVSTAKRNEYRRKTKEKTEADGPEGEGDGEATHAAAENDSEKQQQQRSREGPTSAAGATGEDLRSAKRVKGKDGVVAAPGEEGDDDDGMEVDEEEEGEGQEEEEEDEEEEDDDEEEEEEDDDEDDADIDVDPAAAQLERESQAVNDGESGEESD